MTLDRGFKCLTSKLIGDQFALTTFSLTFCHLSVTRVECLNDVTIQSYSIRRSLSLSSLSFFTLLRPLPSSFFDSMISQIMLTYFVRQLSLYLRLTFCFICLLSAALLMVNVKQIYFLGQIQTSQTGGIQQYFP